MWLAGINPDLPQSPGAITGATGGRVGCTDEPPPPPGHRKGRLPRAINNLNPLVGRAERIVAQTRSRLAGVMPESASRVVSLHDVDARPVRKGRRGKPDELVYKAQ